VVLGKKQGSISKNKPSKRTGGVAQVRKSYLPSKKPCVQTTVPQKNFKKRVGNKENNRVGAYDEKNYMHICKYHN
jgi:hypothetical protein